MLTPNTELTVDVLFDAIAALPKGTLGLRYKDSVREAKEPYPRCPLCVLADVVKGERTGVQLDPSYALKLALGRQLTDAEASAISIVMCAADCPAHPLRHRLLEAIR